MPYAPILKVCEWCGNDFMARLPKVRFCTKKCSSRSRWADPEYRERNLEKMVNAPKPPGWAERASRRMKERNPSRDPEIAARIRETLKASGHYRRVLNGGNGKGPTEAERLLLEHLPPGWEASVTQSTKPQPKGYPSHYKIDLARRDIMLGVECDGWSHTLEGRAEQDAKKTAYLESRGWTILRFSNQEILNDTQRVVDEVNRVALSLSTTSKLSRPTTSQEGS